MCDVLDITKSRLTLLIEQKVALWDKELQTVVKEVAGTKARISAPPGKLVTAARRLWGAKPKIKTHAQKVGDFGTKNEVQKVLTSIDLELDSARARFASQGAELRQNLKTSIDQLQKKCGGKAPEAIRIKQKDSTFAVQAVDYLFDRYRMPAPLSSTKNGCVEGPLNPLAYQKVIRALFDPSVFDVNGLLMYHSMGTGKTCSIVLVVEALFEYYLTQKKSGGGSLNDLPCAFILIQNKTGLVNFVETVERGCRVRKGGVEWVEQKLNETDSKSNDAKMYHLFEGTTKVLKVCIQRMAVQTKASFNFGKSATNTTPLPSKGVVIVDEAHNLVNSTDVSTFSENATQKFADEIMRRKDLPVLLSTGTPVMCSERFTDLARLMDLVRRPEEKDRFFSNQDVKDLDRLRQSDKLGWKACVSIESRSKVERRLRDEFFEIDRKADVVEEEGVTPEPVYKWKSGKREEFQRLVGPYISYMDLENDPSIYPRQVARFPGQDDLANEDYVIRADFSEGVAFPGVRQEPTVIAPLVKIQIPTHIHQWDDMVKYPKGKVPSGRSNVQSSNKAVPHKWRVLKLLLEFYGDNKHFIFHPTKGGAAEWTSGFRGYQNKDKNAGLIAWLCREMDCTEMEYKVKELEPLGNDNLADRVKKWYEKNGPKLRLAYLIDNSAVNTGTRIARDNQVMLAIYNDPRNRDGHYVRYLFANLPHKEGINVTHTSFCHIMQPIQSVSTLRQVLARVRRNCGFKDQPDQSKWLTTTFVYIALPPSGDTTGGNSGAMFEVRFSNPTLSGSPTDLAEEAMQDAALDCSVFSEYLGRTGRPCAINATRATPGLSTWKSSWGPDLESQYAMLNGYCFDPSGHNPPLVIGLVRQDGDIGSTEECFSRNMIPGGLLAYSEEDELLYRLLVKYGYTGRALAKPEVLQQFGWYVSQGRIQKPTNVTDNKWMSKMTNMLDPLMNKFKLGLLSLGIGTNKGSVRLSLASKIPVFELVSWIRFNPPAVGDAVLYILGEKRDSVSPAELQRLEATVKSRVEVALALGELVETVEATEADVAGLRKRVEKLFQDMRSLSKRLS
jgi:hypothetical protein